VHESAGRRYNHLANPFPNPSLQDIMAARIALVVFPGFQILDFAALTVFEIANKIHGTARYAVETVSHGGGIVASSAGVPVDTKPIGRRAYDTLLIAGPTVVTPAEPELLAALRRASPRAPHRLPVHGRLHRRRRGPAGRPPRDDALGAGPRAEEAVSRHRTG
jgi:hypothetical protein